MVMIMIIPNVITQVCAQKASVVMMMVIADMIAQMCTRRAANVDGRVLAMILFINRLMEAVGIHPR